MEIQKCPPGPEPELGETEDEFYRRNEAELKRKAEATEKEVYKVKSLLRRKIYSWSIKTTEYGYRSPRSIFEEPMIGADKEVGNE